ncbi:T-lymphocyte activation antigen CD86 isoform X3 [Myiozetetes cayanensis]|uniref:T-lymphocyte activation antigen CD86 isoform X3 n=1 Tax=Myiozetetes cayanensis TaxID=478635 RepID=UPI002160744D|nr:T-lymphocyte activation antigen CD86 isoform X3 [Myiozetetes cayanensis]
MACLMLFLKARKHTEVLAPVYAKSVMEVCIFLICAMIPLPGIATSVHRVKAFLNHTAYLSCYFPNPQKIDVRDLIVFWQKDSDSVVNELYYGEEKYDHLSPEYINRTKVDVDKWTLQLLNAGVKDEGCYECIIQHKKEGPPKVIHTSECSLHIIGYPEPKEMTWLMSYENTTNRHMPHMDVSQDAVTKLYNVTSNLNIPVPTNSLANISCLLHLREQLGILVSAPLRIEIQEQGVEQVNINFSGPLIAVVVLVTLLLGFVILKNRNIFSTNQSGNLAV